MKQNLFDNKVWKISITIGVMLSIVAAIIKILVGFDIDEAYAITMPYRMLQGDRLFTDMWEVHQTSSFLPVIFCEIFIQLTGEIEYLVLFLRIAATIVHLGVTVWLFVILKKAVGGSKIPWFSALVYFNFLPKWLINLDFSMQQLWFTTISLLFLYKAVTSGKRRHFFGGGVSLAMAVLAYPGMVFVYPFLLVSIWVLTLFGGAKMSDEQKTLCRKQAMRNCLVFTLGCAVSAVVFFIYLFSYMNLQQLLEAIPMVFSDGSHQYDMATKLMLYAKQWIEVLVQSGILIVPCIIVTFVYAKIFKVKFTFSRFFAIFLLLTRMLVICARFVGLAWGPFRLQVRYLLVFCGGIYFYMRGRKECSKMETYAFWLGLFPTIGMLLGILLASNVGPSSSASYLVIGNITAILLAGAELVEHEKTTRKLRFRNADSILAYGSMFVFVISLIMCKGFYVRVTEYPPANVLEERVKLTQGAAKGIWVYPDDAKRMENDYQTIANATEHGDRILFLGTESLNNLTRTGDKKFFVSPTTISTPAFNEQWTAYFTMYPEKQPDVIFIAKNTIDNRDKFFDKNHFGKWIAKYYDIENMTETDSLCVIYK